MELKVIKIDGEFVIVETKNGEKKICPFEIFPDNIKTEDIVVLVIKKS